MERYIKRFIRWLRGVLCTHNNHQHKELMAALENLTVAIQDLTTAVDAAVTVLNTPHPTDAQVQAAADAVNAQVARLNLASGVTPVEPPPAG